MGSLLDSILKGALKLRRRSLSIKLFRAHNGVVQRGPFAGLKLGLESNIGKGTLATKVFGLYEGVVMERICEWAPFETVVNLGGADGYFPLGMVKAGLAKRAIVFELTEKGRAAIRANAQANGIADRIAVEGAADDTVLARLSANEPFDNCKCLVLCDIEGAEFKVLTKRFLESFAGARLIVELHDLQFNLPTEVRQALISSLPPGYQHEIIREGPAEWSGIADLEGLCSNDRALVVSEGRKVLGEWLVAWPA